MELRLRKRNTGRRKPKYGIFSCVGYIYRLLWRTEKGLALTGIFTVPLSLALSALALYTPTLVIRALETSDRFTTVAMVILGLLMAKLLFELCNNIIRRKTESSEFYVISQMEYIWHSRERDRDWYLQFDPEVRGLDERAKNAFNSNHTAGVHFPMDFAAMTAALLNFLLFGSVISMLNPLIILLLALGSYISYVRTGWERRKNWESQDVRNAIGKKISYSTFGISRDHSYAKDIRLYHMNEGLGKRLAHLLRLGCGEQWKLERRGEVTALVDFFVVFIRDCAAYAFLIYKAIGGEVDAAAFVLYFSAITSMSGVMSQILSSANRMLDGALQISDFREGMEVSDKLNRGQGIPIPREPFSIEFKNVSYQYPQGEKKILDNISFRIEPGEKVALVGVNGAGKTTLTMLMCGLLLPDHGEILLNGHSIFEYNRDEMYSLFGLVPQNYHLLPISIAENIASVPSEEIDRKRLARCMELAGLAEKIASLSKKEDTPLNREINMDGVELSGGETQKLLLARLLYKDPYCIILDEPTAALDPIAEDRMYRQYMEIAFHATSIFISHRMASTQFCDRIFLLDGAKFAEVGTHEELLAARGKYWELYEVQSKYYRESAQE